MRVCLIPRRHEIPRRRFTRASDLTRNDTIDALALFVFTTKDAAEKFVTEDPYVSNGIVVGHSISEWTVVVGDN